MTARQIFLLAISVIAAGVLPLYGATTFSAMDVGEVSLLLSEAASAKDAANHRGGYKATLPVELTANDMVRKVYGVVDPGLSKKECRDYVGRALSLTPQEEDGVMWLDSDNGYIVNYYGLFPCTSAMAHYGQEGIMDYGYFFIFPYLQGTKADVVRDQADFCGTLMQEMHDCGMPLDLNVATDDLFEALGDVNGNLVDVRLLDDREETGNGRFILILSVEPNAL